MLLNRLEKTLMNNPLRAMIQRHIEAKRLLTMGGQQAGKTVLEVGCGRGVGTELILTIFGAAHVDAFDLDPHMVQLARKRLVKYGNHVRLWDGSVTEIQAEDNTYDAVFDFAIVHHVPDWRKALAEVHRVLKPGGRFYAEEVFKAFITHPLWKRLLDHPQLDRFDHDTFRDALSSHGFQIIATKQIWDQMGWFIADKLDPGSSPG